MSLQELTEPLFNYICMLNRVGRKGGSVQLNQVRNKIKELFDEMDKQAYQTPGLSDQFKQVRLPLVFFVDSIIAESSLPFAAEWHKNRLAYSYNERAGDERFFDLLDEVSRERGEEAEERQAVFYTCLGLGFVGYYASQPEVIKDKMLELGSRIRSRMEKSFTQRLCQEAYENVDHRDFSAPPSRSLMGMVIILVGLMLVLFVANCYQFRGASSKLRTSLKTVVEKAAANKSAVTEKTNDADSSRGDENEKNSP